MTGSQLLSKTDLLASIAAKSDQSSLNLGQVTCLGMDRLKETMGADRFDQAKALIEAAFEDALGSVLDRDDTYFRTREGDLLLVFGSEDSKAAKAKSARIAETVNQAVLGHGDGLSGVRIVEMIATPDGLSDGDALDPAAVIADLNEKAKKAFREKAGNQGDADDGELDSSFEDNIQSLVEGAKLESRLREIGDGKIGVEYFPTVDLGQEKVARYHGVPTFHHSLRATPEIGYDVLSPTHRSGDIVDLDLAVFEVCVERHLKALEGNLGTDLSFPIHFETLCEPSARGRVLDLLGSIPATARRTVSPVFSGIPYGVPQGRLGDLSRPFLDADVRPMVALRPEARRSEFMSQLSQLATAGIGALQLDLPTRFRKGDRAWLSVVGLKDGGRKFSITVGNACTPKAVMALMKHGVEFAHGPLFGGPFDMMVASYEVPLSGLSARGNLAMTHSKIAGLPRAEMPAIADSFGVTFAVTKPDDEGVPCFYFLSDSVTRLTGYKPDELVGGPVTFLQTDETDGEKATRFYRRLEKAGEATVVLANQRKDGSVFGNKITAIVAPEAHRQPPGTFYAFLEKARVPRGR